MSGRVVLAMAVALACLVVAPAEAHLRITGAFGGGTSSTPVETLSDAGVPETQIRPQRFSGY